MNQMKQHVGGRKRKLTSTLKEQQAGNFTFSS